MNVLRLVEEKVSLAFYLAAAGLLPCVAHADAAVPRNGSGWGLLGILVFVTFGFPVIGISFLIVACFAKRKKGWLIWGGILLLISAPFWYQVFFT